MESEDVVELEKVCKELATAYFDVACSIDVLLDTWWISLKMTKPIHIQCDVKEFHVIASKRRTEQQEARENYVVRSS